MSSKAPLPSISITPLVLARQPNDKLLAYVILDEATPSVGAQKAPQKLMKSHCCVPFTATFSKRRKIGAR